MTVSKSIVEWLKGYDLKAIRVDTDQVGEGADSMGLFKSPNREVQVLIGNSYQITEHYQLYAVRDGQEHCDREDNDEWLENFAYWVDDRQYKGELPELDKDRSCVDIMLESTPCMFEAKENNTALYQISLKITYTREREDNDEW